jgi:hypothetical protein
MSTRTSPPAITLRGRWLLPARVAWVAVAITVLAIVLFSVPSSFEHYRTVCTAASEVCSERAVGQPTPEGVRALREMGLSVRSYALFNVVVERSSSWCGSLWVPSSSFGAPTTGWRF